MEERPKYWVVQKHIYTYVYIQDYMEERPKYWVVQKHIYTYVYIQDYMEEHPKFWVGMLSQKRIRKVRLVNMLTKDEHTIEVCAEDTLEQIKDKYLVYNRYVYMHVFKNVCVCV